MSKYIVIPAQPRWEYEFVPRHNIDKGAVSNMRDIEQRLNDYGDDGWELVAIDYGGFIFKRMVQEES